MAQGELKATVALLLPRLRAGSSNQLMQHYTRFPALCPCHYDQLLSHAKLFTRKNSKNIWCLSQRYRSSHHQISTAYFNVLGRCAVVCLL